MKTLSMITLGAALVAAACGGTSASDADTPLVPEASVATGASAQAGTAAKAPAEARPAAVKAAAGPVYRDITMPAGTTLSLKLTTPVASDTSDVEDAVGAELTDAVRIDGREIVPAGATVTGVVTEANDAGHVKGRAQVALRFTSLRRGSEQYEMQTASVTRQAPATKGEDATKIGIGAGAGAAIGGLLGGKKGAAQGAAVGGAAGTGVVLATRGKEVRLASGADVSTQLTAPLMVRVRLRE